MKEPFEDVGRRLVRLSEAVGVIGAEIARRSDGAITPSRWTEYTQGRRLITIEAATSLRRLFGVTLDYIYLGDEAGLPRRLADQLHRAA